MFRIYKGVRYQAKATAGRWSLVNTGQFYDSLNALSNALGASENSWVNWFYRGENGIEHKIDALRDKNRITKRSK